MVSRIRPVGNSLGLILPRGVVREAGLKPGEPVFPRVVPEGILLSKHPSDPRIRAFMGAIRPMLGREVLLVCLFGSYATRRFREGRSDIDLYIVARDPGFGETERHILLRAFSINERQGAASKLAPVCLPESQFDPGWFKYEVLPGFPLYVSYEWRRRWSTTLPSGTG